LEYSIEVVAIDTIKNKTYYRLKRTDFRNNSKISYEYKRESNDTLFGLANSIYNNEYIEYIEAAFSLNIGDTICSYPVSRLNSECRSPIVVTLKSGDKMEFFHNSQEMIHGGHWITYQKWKGIIKNRNQWGGSIELLECNISSIVVE
jgi:hypothetical protein